MSDHRIIDDSELVNVSGAGSDEDLKEELSEQNDFRKATSPPPLPPDTGGPGADVPESGGGGGGNQDLQI